MEISFLLFKQIAQFFIMIIMGYTLVKLKIVKSEDSKVLSMVCLYLIMPCVIINSFLIEFTPEKLKGLGLAVGVAIVIHFVAWVFIRILGKVLSFNPVEKASVMYSNAANMVIPVVMSVLGDEWVLYSSAFVSVQLVLLWTHCKSMLSNEKGFELKKIYTNINLIAIFIGILLFITKIHIPSVLQGTLKSVGGTVAPISMIITGMIMAGAELKKVFVNGRIYLVLFFRMIFFPFIVFMIIYFTGITKVIDNGAMILLVTFIATITPTASSITQMAQVYGNNEQYAGAINIMTTIVSIVTMPIMVALYCSFIAV
ncbi:MAG: AEC family transporter [Eubacterium sp.]|jgi:predicted permease|nr:AEC family transporter [Eubacterium sp.]